MAMFVVKSIYIQNNGQVVDLSMDMPILTDHFSMYFLGLLVNLILNEKTVTTRCFFGGHIRCAFSEHFGRTRKRQRGPMSHTRLCKAQSMWPARNI